MNLKNNFLVDTFGKVLGVAKGKGKLLTEESMNNVYIKSITSYLYEANYANDNISYSEADKIMNNMVENINFGCSVFKVGNIIGRNFDSYYNNSCSVIVNSKKTSTRYASIGVTSGIDSFNANALENDKEVAKIIPFFMVDGINEHKLYVSVNLVNVEVSEGITIGTLPSIEQRERINMLMLPRYILDNFKSVYEAIEYIESYVSVYNIPKLSDKYEYHFFISDPNNTAIIEFHHNEIYIKPVYGNNSTPWVLTNFYYKDVNFNPDATVTRNTDSSHNVNGITPYGSGLERHNIIVNNRANVVDVDSAKQLLKDIYYTKLYTLNDNIWYSELVGIEFTVTTPASDFAPVLNAARNAYNNRDRNNPQTWQTVHSVVYDLDNLSLDITVQQSNMDYKFAISKEVSYEEIKQIIETSDKGIINTDTITDFTIEQTNITHSNFKSLMSWTDAIVNNFFSNTTKYLKWTKSSSEYILYQLINSHITSTYTEYDFIVKDTNNKFILSIKRNGTGTSATYDITRKNLDNLYIITTSKTVMLSGTVTSVTDIPFLTKQQIDDLNNNFNAGKNCLVKIDNMGNTAKVVASAFSSGILSVTLEVPIPSYSSSIVVNYSYDGSWVTTNRKIYMKGLYYKDNSGTITMDIVKYEENE